MAKRNIHTVPKGSGWAVEREKAHAPISTHRTKAAAEKKAIAVAKQDGVEHVIHGRDGKIQDKDSYGHDPYPPKDDKH